MMGIDYPNYGSGEISPSEAIFLVNLSSYPFSLLASMFFDDIVNFDVVRQLVIDIYVVDSEFLKLTYVLIQIRLANRKQTGIFW